MSRFTNFFKKSFLERNQILIGSLGILVILAGSALALLLSGGVLEKTYGVTAFFEDGAGLRAGDDVTVAGLDAGTIGAVRIEGGTVVMDLKIKDGVEMPVDSTANIVVETLLGRKSVDLVAGESNEPLAGGDKIPIERTTTPIEITDLNDISVELMESSDAQALEDLMSNVTAITEGKEVEIQAVIDGLADVTEVLADKKQELRGVIESLDTLSHTFAEEDETIVSLIENYNVVLGNLAERRDDLASLLINTDSAAAEVADLVGRNRPVFDSMLASLHETLTVVNDHQLDLAATISYLEQSVEGYSSVGTSSGVPNRWANIFVQSLGPLGVDAIVGPCGLVDQALDELLGPDPRDCEDRRNFGDADEGEEEEEDPEGPTSAGGEGLPDEEIPELPLPGGIGDLVDSVTGGFLGLGSGR